MGLVRDWLRRADRVLLHPWTTRLGAAQAILGAGTLLAGLLGGTVTLVFGFPLGWAVVTAVGAFLLGLGGLATLIDQLRPIPLWLALTDHKRVLDELIEEGYMDQDIAQENANAIYATLIQRRAYDAADRFLNAGNDEATSLDRLTDRLDVLAQLITESRSGRDGQRSLASEPTGELGEDRQVGMEPDTLDSSDAEGE